MIRQEYENVYDHPEVILDKCSSKNYDYSMYSSMFSKYNLEKCVEPEICDYKYRVNDCIKVVYHNKKDDKYAKTIYQKLTEEEDASGKFDLNKFPINGHEGNWIPMQIYDYDGNIVRDYNKGKVIGRNNGNLIYDGVPSSIPTYYSDIFGLKSKKSQKIGFGPKNGSKQKNGSNQKKSRKPKPKKSRKNKNKSNKKKVK